MKNILLSLLLCGLLLCGCAPAPRPEAETLQVVAAIFPAYDFARAAAGDLAEVSLLLPPGAESHSYEPTPADILAVRDCDLFLYLGGESDAWVDTILDAVEPTGTALRMVDCVDLLEETALEGMWEQPGHERGQVVELDEHVWTAPENAAAITLAIGEALASLDPEHETDYLSNAQDYARRLGELDQAFAAFFESLPDRTMVFGDRFPLQYFADAYQLDCFAAFPGCSTQTEPSAAAIAFLTEKVRAEGISTVWYIEFSNHLVADSIAEAAGVGTAMFHVCHNVSRAELEAGATYLSLMEGNLETLRARMG